VANSLQVCVICEKTDDTEERPENRLVVMETEKVPQPEHAVEIHSEDTGGNTSGDGGAFQECTDSEEEPEEKEGEKTTNPLSCCLKNRVPTLQKALFGVDPSEYIHGGKLPKRITALI
ncbi:MAG: uncharacterized protein A8A55_3649, partial [Amphiamblys sp. WSBS2006]